MQAATAENHPPVSVAAVQMSSGHDLDANLSRADELIAQAAERGARLVVLPENFAFLGLDESDKVSIAEPEGDGPIQGFVAATARRHALWVVAGSVPLESPDRDRCYGASIVYDESGRPRACYRKMHLFDVDLPDSEENYRESATMYPGDEPAVCDSPLGRLGLTICYDVRFPELYRQLVELGAVGFTIPSAFTETTGAAHWEVLLRARAIENQAWVIAPGQQGRHSNGRVTYGHTMIVDPWGQIVAHRASGEGLVIADLDPVLPEKLRKEFPALSHRRRTHNQRN